MIVALDGPAASGKGTIGRRLAAEFGIGYLDTGAMFRVVGRAALDAGADLDDAEAVLKVAKEIDLDDQSDPRLHDAETGQAASRVAVHRVVRGLLLEAQRAFANRPGGAVLDGRDIGTVVFPDADLKFFITASTAARAARRAAQLREMGATVDEAELAKELELRDNRDRQRAAAPLRRADDAILLDTTHMSIDAAFDTARRHMARRLEELGCA